MTLLTADQAIFFSVSAILLACLANSLAVFRKHGKSANEGFWLWGLAFLPIAYLGYGLGPWLGLPSLVVANTGFMLAYLSLALQLRYWETGKSDVPVWLIAACAGYLIGFEVLRLNYPYAARATFGQGLIWLVIVYLLLASIKLYRKTGSVQMLLLGTTFAIESLCAASRVVLLWLVQIPGPDPSHLLAEPFYMVIARWVWLVTNAISYLTIMTYVLEKILDRNTELDSLLKEKRQLLNAMAKLTRNRNASDTASALTHELAQPMSTIYLASQELKARIGEGEHGDLRALGDLLSSESTRSTKIMKQLDELFRSPNLPKQAVSIDKVIKHALDVLIPRLKANQIDLRRHGDFSQAVLGETTQLESVFVNILSNSVTALSGQSGLKVIEIRALETEDQCVIEVCDNGPGIDPLILQAFGEPYVYGEQQGSGIGLWLSKLIIDSHQGLITIENWTVGGTRVCISLPRPVKKSS